MRTLAFTVAKRLHLEDQKLTVPDFKDILYIRKRGKLRNDLHKCKEQPRYSGLFYYP